VLIYVSDHGQSLGESGFYLHGAPNAVAPKQQREIPFLVWMSDGFKARKGITDADIIPAETFPHDLPFHSVMGAFGMKSDIYKPEFNIFQVKK
jgi:lipid A ethanolaminephosphotransferase